MDADRELRLFQRLSSDSDFRLWLELEERREIGALVEQVEPVRIYHSQARLKFIQMLGKKMQAARDRFKG